MKPHVGNRVVGRVRAKAASTFQCTPELDLRRLDGDVEAFGKPLDGMPSEPEGGQISSSSRSRA